MFARGEALAHGSTRPTQSGQRNQVESETQPTETFMVKPFRDTDNRAILDSRQIVRSCVRHHLLLEEATSQDQASSTEDLLRSAISVKASSGIPSPLQSVAARRGLLGPHQGTEGALVAQSCQDMVTDNNDSKDSSSRHGYGRLWAMYSLLNELNGTTLPGESTFVLYSTLPPTKQGNWG